ncbi:hypothetical protein L596_014527 [Steinernema carpocapsae]|uniref:CHK kinase-like domain-containing protein n=1 Tax=Steinernema carpocapsae TaxID=34508 RepID=A0A4U5NC91_STECR|nr:hypothetical protein L596_014527 [Steinernema carpocapsae]
MTTVIQSPPKSKLEKEEKTTTIETTNFEVEFVLERIRSVSGNDKVRSENINSINVLDITGGSAFFSRVLRVTFNWNDSLIEPKSVILKVPRIAISAQLEDDPDSKEDHTYLETAHTREIQFYEAFANRGNGLRLPVFYYGYEYSRKHDKGVLVMEDLSQVAKTMNILPGFNNTQIENLIDELARLVAVSWKDRSWVEPMIENPDREEFIELVKGFAKQLRNMQPRFNAVLDRLDPLFHMNSYEQSVYKNEKYGFPAAIVHQDLWAPNILWRVDENGDVTDDLCALIDWQGVHAGNPIEDLGRLLSLNTTSEYRRKNMDRLLKLYLAKLREYCEGECPSTRRTFTWLTRCRCRT